MGAKATTHTYKQPVPTQNWFSYTVLIQKYTPSILKYRLQIQEDRVQSCRDRHAASISADDKA